MFAGVRSITPTGTVIVAVLVIEPVADAVTVALTVYVAVPLANRLTVVFRLPEPLAESQDEPLDAEHVHVTLVNAAGKVSVTGALVTCEGPALFTTIV